MRRLLDSWLWLLALFTVAAFLETVFWGQMQAFSPLYLLQLGVAPSAVPQTLGVIAALSGAVGIPFLPFWGALADRYARQPIIVRSFVVYFGGGLIVMLARNVWVLLLGRALLSLSLGNSGLMLTTLSERAPQRRVGLAFAIMNSASPVGAFLGPLVGGPVVDHWGFRTLLAIDAGLMLFVIAGLSFGYRDAFRGSRRGSLGLMAVDSVRIVWRSPRLRALFVALFFLFAGWILATTYAPVVITHLYHGSDPGTAVGVVLGAGGLVAMVLGPALGALGDRFGHWRVLLVGALGLVLLWPWPALAPSLASFAVLWAVLNGVISGLFAMSFSVLSFSAAPEVRGRVMSLCFLPVNFGSVLGPAIGAAITRGSVLAVFPAGALLTLLGIGMLLVARRHPVAQGLGQAATSP